MYFAVKCRICCVLVAAGVCSEVFQGLQEKAASNIRAVRRADPLWLQRQQRGEGGAPNCIKDWVEKMPEVPQLR